MQTRLYFQRYSISFSIHKVHFSSNLSQCLISIFFFLYLLVFPKTTTTSLSISFVHSFIHSNMARSEITLFVPLSASLSVSSRSRVPNLIVSHDCGCVVLCCVFLKRRRVGETKIFRRLTIDNFEISESSLDYTVGNIR